MIIPNVKYYAQLTESTAAGRKTPRYTITKESGYFPQLEALKGKDGKISFYLMEGKRGSEGKDSTPPMQLQGKNSYRLTGLKDYYTEQGGLSGFCYGNPNGQTTYGKDNKINPLYECRHDCFLFVVHHDGKDTTPKGFEMLVLDKQKNLSASYCKALAVGQFNDLLEQLRQTAISVSGEV